MIDKEAIEGYRARWQLVAEVEAQEQSQMTAGQRLRQLDFLFQSAVTMGIYLRAVEQNHSEAEIVRQRWNSLKAKLAYLP